ncbi:MAG: small multi-drug export protein [Candidatus Thalassarchaeaceae archaeon]
MATVDKSSRLDLNEDGQVNLGDVSHIITEAEKIRLDRDLDSIRERRLGDTRFFRWAVEDYVLLFGVVFGGLFVILITVASTGMIAGDSVAIDQTLSRTPLDTGGECMDKQGEIWLSVFEDHHDLRARSYNVPDGDIAMRVIYLDSSNNLSDELQSGTGDLSVTIDGENIMIGEQYVQVSIHEIPLDSMQGDNLSEIVESSPAIFDQEFRIEVEHKSRGGLFSSGEVIDIDVEETGPRACMTFKNLGEWGWLLMAAEWAGGRETAMLTGGSGGVPAWWMAFVSLGMSIVFLYIQYPLMHKMYHREGEETLDANQVERLIVRILEHSQDEASIEIDFERLRMQDRPISIDVFVPYTSRSQSIMTLTEVRSILMRDLLSEFAIFGEMRPLQLRVQSAAAIKQTEEPIVMDSSMSLEGFDPSIIDADYRSFFDSISIVGMIEDSARPVISELLDQYDLADEGTLVSADNQAVYVRMIYRPLIRFSYFLFPRNFIEIEDSLSERLEHDLADLLNGRKVIVSARNLRRTLADQAVAGRVEQGGSNFSGEALVAKQPGITGTLLQTVGGDILSSVEYVAQRNRKRIDKYGFWGLIVFVWIPFMASGVLVGAMLGLVARMKFERVLFACTLGGTAASITWAYTARGIIEFMERYQAEVLIPFLIGLVFLFTFFHLRRNKRRRREELFRESMAFFNRVSLN